MSDMLKLSMQLFYIKILILMEKVDFHVGKSSGRGEGGGGGVTLAQLKSKVPQSGQVFIGGGGVLWTNSNPKSLNLAKFLGLLGVGGWED